VLCGDMLENDVVVCFELPCHAQQSRTYKRAPGDPFIVPVYLSDSFRASTYTSLNRGNSLFGYPMVIAVDQEQATGVNAMYDLVVTRLQRWTANARDLFDWEAGIGNEDGIDDVPIELNVFPPVDTITEIKENGDVVTVQEPPPPEGDIVDEKRIDDGVDTDPPVHIVPMRVGIKRDVFTLRLQVNHKDYGTAYHGYSASTNWQAWDRRRPAGAEPDTPTVLLRENDAFYCEFDDHMKAYYFGDDRTFEHSRWTMWEEFVHPEYTEAQKAGAEKKQKGISLEDCLEEFTKEEQLGEDDLWYCPRCKKHQQATKKFDLWKAPDVLVVHLKRFSNSRTLRDKIDAFVDFPVEGLDLGGLVGERAVARRLAQQGVSLEELGLSDADEPLVYDLFGVDEHLGGLGGGHYRAYALNHATEKWYHFDDSYVMPARASDAVVCIPCFSSLSLGL
jgi:ubiquitin carboxyl-terminal hydrolase 4/11/15